MCGAELKLLFHLLLNDLERRQFARIAFRAAVKIVVASIEVINIQGVCFSVRFQDEKYGCFYSCNRAADSYRVIVFHVPRFLSAPHLYKSYHIFMEVTTMSEQIVNILNKIVEAKGAEYAKGFVDGVNLTTPEKATEEKSQPA